MFTLIDLGAVFFVIAFCFFLYNTIIEPTPSTRGACDGAITVSLLLFGVHHIFQGTVPVGIVCIVMATALVIKNTYYV